MCIQQLKNEKEKNVGINWIPSSSWIQIKKRSGKEQVFSVVVDLNVPPVGEIDRMDWPS